jgi:hypothetical protein
MAWHGDGYGLRVAQVMGLHRKKSYGINPTVEGELGKRAFWYGSELIIAGRYV